MLHLYHSNQLDPLAEAMLHQMDRHPPAVLQQDIVLVQNPGMKRWLQQRISQHQGIAANLHFPLPSRFIWDIFLQQFDDVETLSSFDGEVLRWQLLSILQQQHEDEGLKPLKPYLTTDSQELAVFQLAEKLAALFDQYLVYRPHMIDRWEQGRCLTKDANEAWQARLWQLLRQQNPAPHRAKLIHRLIEHLQNLQKPVENLPARVFVFAISSLSPQYQQVLAALGQHMDVHVFNLNPCMHYWGDIESKKEQLRRGEDAEPINELLASLGKQGRDYIDQFYQLGFDYEEHTHFGEISGNSLLARIQRQMLTLSPAECENLEVQDNSCRFVSCYSELRELQVLHDYLLELLQQDETLQAHDIVVMCPDINRQAALINAVFGQQPEHQRIPFTLSDHNLNASQPLLQAIVEWIGLAGKRFSASEILGWLELPALQRAYGLDAEAIDSIRYWVASNHIHWGYDAAHKQRLGFDAVALNTWQQGIDRLLTAYIMHDQTQLFAEHLASDIILNSEDYQALGKLQHLLDDLLRWSQRLTSGLTLPQWRSYIHEMLYSLLQPDDDEEWQLRPLRDEIAGWHDQAEVSGFDNKVDASVIQHLLRNALQQRASHHHYLTGAINFCNMIPMRTLPFKVVCMIGMSDDQFPRNDTPLQLDLVHRYPQKGDRSSRDDDRYLFLQSLLSAQQHLYLSFVGKDRKDDSVREPSVVITELLDFIEQNYHYRPLIEQTTLQAFAIKNFERGSYADQWYPVRSKTPRHAFGLPIPAVSIEHMTLQELITFYRNPQKYFLTRRLDMRLDENTELHDDDEIFTLQPLQCYQTHRRMLDELLEQGEIEPKKYLYSGELPEQNAGLLQWQQLSQPVKALYQALTEHENYTGWQRISEKLSLTIELSGQLISYSNHGLLDVTLSSLKGKSLFEFWIKHCFLCACQPEQSSVLFSIEGKSQRFHLLPAAQAKAHLQRLIDAFFQGQQQPLAFYVETAYLYETTRQKSDENRALEKISQQWRGDGFKPFYEAQDPYLQTSLKNSGYGADRFDDRFFELSESLMLPMLEGMVTENE